MLGLSEALRFFIVHVGISKTPLLVCDVEEFFDDPLAPFQQLIVFGIIFVVLSVAVQEADADFSFEEVVPTQFVVLRHICA